MDVYYSEQPTNGIAYFRSVIRTDTLPDELQDYLPLFCSVLCSLGTDRHSYEELAQHMKNTAGGFTSAVHLARDPTSPEEHEQGVRFMSYCLERNLDEMFNTWGDIFSSCNFEEVGYLKTLIAMGASDMVGSLAQSGHTYAQLVAASKVSQTAVLANRHSGLDQIVMAQTLAARDDLSDVKDKLKQVASWVLNPDNMRCSVVADESTMASTMSALEGFVVGLTPTATPSQVLAAGEPLPPPDTMSTYVTTPFTVNYAARSIPTVAYTHPDSAALSVAARAMTAKFLHREIREKGGAYGGGATAQNGLFGFYSYRDPKYVSCTLLLCVMLHTLIERHAMQHNRNARGI